MVALGPTRPSGSRTWFHEPLTASRPGSLRGRRTNTRLPCHDRVTPHQSHIFPSNSPLTRPPIHTAPSGTSSSTCPSRS